MNRNLLPVVVALLAATMVLNSCQSTPTTSVTEDELAKLEDKITALEGRLSEKEATIGELCQELEELQTQPTGPRPLAPTIVKESPPSPPPEIISEQPSTGLYDRALYKLITVRPAGNGVSFTLRPNQHYSITIFAEEDPKSDIEVYYTGVPKERMADSIYVEYERPNRDYMDSGVVVGRNRSVFGIVAPSKGWYTIDYYYDVPKGMLASSLTEVDIYVRWEIDE